MVFDLIVIVPNLPAVLSDASLPKSRQNGAVLGFIAYISKRANCVSTIVYLTHCLNNILTNFLRLFNPFFDLGVAQDEVLCYALMQRRKSD